MIGDTRIATEKFSLYFTPAETGLPFEIIKLENIGFFVRYTDGSAHKLSASDIISIHLLVETRRAKDIAAKTYQLNCSS